MIPTRLYWHRDRGLAQHEGVAVTLCQAPMLPGVHGLSELDYAPAMIGQLRIGCDRIRELTPLEAAACMLILKRVALAARAALLEPIGPDLKA